MQIITLDFETYYDNDYSLTKLTTEEYIRDPRFEIIGVGVKVNDEKTKYFSGTHRALRAKLLEYNLHENAVLSHHAHFDIAILNWILGIKPGIILDTLSMARGLHGASIGNSLAKLAEHYNAGVKGDEVINAKGKHRVDFTPDEMRAYGRYCKGDCDLTRKIFLDMRPHYTLNELRVIDMTVRMFTEPALRVDVPLLEKHIITVREKKQKLLESCGVDKKDLMSNDKFAELLRRFDVEPPIKVSKTTGKEAYAFAKTDEGFKELLEHEDERVQILAAARVGNKSTLEESRTQRFIDIGKRGLIPVPLQYYGAHTGRWSATGKLNFQNLPSRGKGVNTLKRALLAPLGHVLIESDLSQIEARLLAWFAGQWDLVEDFALKRDAYIKMASHIYNLPIEAIGKPSTERDVGKEVILASGFGLGGDRFHERLKAQNIHMALAKAHETIAVYRKTYSKIPELWETTGEALVAMMKGQTYKLPNDCVQVVEGGFKLPSGLLIRYENLRYERNKDTGKREMVYNQGRKVVKIYSMKAVENYIQSLANCVIKAQMILINKRYKVALTVHDSIIVAALKEEAEEAMAFVMECMRFVPSWAEGVPLDCEAGYAERYGDC